jgi:penicillin-insensitive murein DD-endopeptidase
MRWAFILAAVGLAGGAARAEPSVPAVWSAFRTPSGGPAQAVGGYSKGCIAGAARLPLKGDGFRVTKPERGRVFGHPSLIALIRELGKQVKKLKLGALPVGDLAQARGGPAPTGHASHQTGLDVDIAYSTPQVSMVDSERKRPSALFTAKVARVLALGAADPRVDRIFVNPVLKQALCERPGADRDWLRKVRPWWGHADHFHVRLACPPDSPACEPQTPLPEGDGCGELAWWFDEKAQAERERERGVYNAKVGAAPELPEGCRALLEPVAAVK